MNLESHNDPTQGVNCEASFGISDDLRIDIFESQINSLLIDAKQENVSAGKAEVHSLCSLPSVCPADLCIKPGEEKAAHGKGGDLLKKNQSLQAELYMARERNRLMCSKLKETELALSKLSSASGEDNKARTNNVDLLQERLRQITQQLTTCRNANVVLSKEVKQAVKALELETGESISSLTNWIAKSTSKETSWRGRQQQICNLTARIRRLEGELRLFRPDIPKAEALTEAASQVSPLGATDLGYELLEPTAIRKAIPTAPPQINFLLYDLDARQQKPFSSSFTSQSAAIKALEEENQTLKEEASHLRERLKTREARISVLNSYLSEQKEKTRLLVEKGAHDHELITSLLQEKEKSVVIAKAAQADRNAAEAKLRSEIERLTSELVKEVQRTKALKVVVEQKEELIKQLTNSQNAHKDAAQDMFECEDQISQRTQKVQHIEASSVYRAVSVERDQLREFIKVLEARCEEMLQETALKDKEIAELRQRCSQVEHASAEVPVKNRKRSSQPGKLQGLKNERLLDPGLASDLLRGISATSRVRPVSEAIRELQTALRLANENLATLTTALKRACEARRQDSALFNQLVNAVHEEYRRNQSRKSESTINPDQKPLLPFLVQDN
ncbi:Coiled-coil domain-containing protein 13 [Sparganum proliferum]